MAKKPIPSTYEECDAADKALFDMKNVRKHGYLSGAKGAPLKTPQAGESWIQISSRYTELSGLSTECKSTLPNRYTRMKAKFAMLRHEDAVLLVRAKVEVDKAQAAEKWQRIAETVVENGGSRYTVSKRHRRAMDRTPLMIGTL